MTKAPRRRTDEQKAALALYHRLWKERMTDEQRQALRDYKKDWRRNLPEDKKEKYRLYHKQRLATLSPDKRERLNEYYRRRRASRTPEQRAQFNQYLRDWFSRNPGADLCYQHTRKAKLIGSGGSHTEQQWAAMKEANNYACLKCGAREPDIKLTRDHIIPVSKGGSNDISNIQPLCFPCNRMKSNKVESTVVTA